MRLGECTKVKVVLGVDARRYVDVELKRLKKIPLQLIATHTDSDTVAVVVIVIVVVVVAVVVAL